MSIYEIPVVRLFLFSTKRLKICFTVPSSWSILNKKNRMCKSDSLFIEKLRVEGHIKIGIGG